MRACIRNLGITLSKLCQYRVPFNRELKRIRWIKMVHIQPPERADQHEQNICHTLFALNLNECAIRSGGVKFGKREKGLFMDTTSVLHNSIFCGTFIDCPESKWTRRLSRSRGLKVCTRVVFLTVLCYCSRKKGYSISEPEFWDFFASICSVSQIYWTSANMNDVK